MNNSQLKNKINELTNLENALKVADECHIEYIEKKINNCKFIISEMQKNYSIKINGEFIEAKVIEINNNDTFNCVVITEKGKVYCELSKLVEVVEVVEDTLNYELTARANKLSSILDVTLSELKSTKNLNIESFIGYKIMNTYIGNVSLILENEHGQLFNVIDIPQELTIRNWRSKFYKYLKESNVYLENLFNCLVLRN